MYLPTLLQSMNEMVNFTFAISPTSAVKENQDDSRGVEFTRKSRRRKEKTREKEESSEARTTQWLLVQVYVKPCSHRGPLTVRVNPMSLEGVLFLPAQMNPENQAPKSFVV